MEFGGRYKSLREYFGNRPKVAIVGFCEDSRHLTPYDDPSFEVWGLNRGALFMPMTPNVTRWNEMHGEHIVKWDNRRPGKHVEWLNAFPGPVYMHETTELVKNSVAFPLALLAEHFGKNVFRIGHMVKGKSKPQSSSAAGDVMEYSGPDDVKDTSDEPYITSSIAYELALAIYEGFEEIHLYGVDLNTDAEYAWQKPGVEYLLGVAAGRGIRVVLPVNCPLLKGTLYGRGYLSGKEGKMSYEQLTKRMTSLQNDQQKTQIQIAQWQGARSELVEYTQAQMLPGIDHEKLEDRRKGMEKNISDLTFKLQQIQGAMQETAFWIHQTEEGQDPHEAIEQLRQSELAAEGPTNDLEEMQHKDGQNGYHDAADLVAVAAI